MDIASGWEEAGETRLYLHPGVKQVQQPWPKVVVGQSGKPEGAAVADLDGDGAMDVITVSEDRNIYLHWAPEASEVLLNPKAWKTEPLPADNPFWAHPNVRVTAHCAGASDGTSERGDEIFLDNLVRYANGDELMMQVTNLAEVGVGAP